MCPRATRKTAASTAANTTRAANRSTSCKRTGTTTCTSRATATANAMVKDMIRSVAKARATKKTEFSPQAAACDVTLKSAAPKAVRGIDLRGRSPRKLFAHGYRRRGALGGDTGVTKA